jgi:hypothetical protein
MPSFHGPNLLIRSEASTEDNSKALVCTVIVVIVVVKLLILLEVTLIIGIALSGVK